MQTNDNEYFRSAVTDEWNTPRPLTEQEQAEEQKQQTFRTKRHKTAQRAFSLAAPVAVVAVAATLVTTAAGPVCRLCGKTQCNYFDSYHEIPAQILYEGDVPAAQPETSDGANRLTYLDYAFGGVESQDQRYFLEIDGQTAGVSNDPVSRLLYSNGVETSPVSGIAHEDEESGARMVCYSNQRDGVPVVYVELIYLPRGGSPGETEAYGEGYLENLFEQGQDYTYAMTACEQPNLWLRAYSAVPEVSAQQVLEAVGKPLVLPVPGSKVEVGSSMYMTLPASQRLWLCDIRWYGYIGEYFYGEDGYATTQRPVYTYSQGPDITDYRFVNSKSSGSDFRIEFAARDWNAVADAWNELYRQAPATGHESYAVQVPLQSVTVNDVTYDVYLDFLKYTEDGEYDGGTVWFVPRQQPTCRISTHIVNQKTADPLSLSGKSLEEISSSGADYRDVLSLFYPAGAEPDPLPAPTPGLTPTPEPTPTPEREIKQRLTLRELIPQYPFDEFKTDEDEQWLEVEFYTKLEDQLTELGYPYSTYLGWGYYDDYYVKGYPYEQDGKMLVYLEFVRLWDGTIPQQSDQYGVDTESYPTYIDWSQTRSYAMRAAEGGYYIRVYSFLDDLTAQEILDNISDKIIS